MSPVDSRVLIRLSPSVPPGRVSTLTVMFGFFAWKSLANCSASFTSWSWFVVRYVISTEPPPASSLDPRLPALHAASTSELTATSASPLAPGRNLILTSKGMFFTATGRWSVGGLVSVGAEHGVELGLQCFGARGKAARTDRLDQFGGGPVQVALQPGGQLGVVGDDPGLGRGGGQCGPGRLVVHELADGGVGGQPGRLGVRVVGGPLVRSVTDLHRLVLARYGDLGPRADRHGDGQRDPTVGACPRDRSLAVRRQVLGRRVRQVLGEQRPYVDRPVARLGGRQAG